MALFGKRQSREFSLPASLRTDLRDLIQAAPPDARARLLSPEGEEAFLLLNQRLPAEEKFLPSFTPSMLETKQRAIWH
jgi:hypothetical protein